MIEQRCDNEINLLNVAIDRQFQNRGTGKKLINHYLDLIPCNCSVFLEFNKSNIIERFMSILILKILVLGKIIIMMVEMHS